MSISHPKMTFRPTPIAPLPKLSGGQARTIDETADAVTKKIPGAVQSVEKSHKGDPFLVVDPAKLVSVIEFLRNDPAYACTMLQTISATDYLPVKAVPAGPEGNPPAVAARTGHIDVLYALWSFTHRHQILIKVILDRDTPRVQSICDLYRAANWYERECWDLLGVVFEGHPDHQRILLPPDWVGHPLRKDYVFPEDYNGMKVPL